MKFSRILLSLATISIFLSCTSMTETELITEKSANDVEEISDKIARELSLYTVINNEGEKYQVTGSPMSLPSYRYQLDIEENGETNTVKIITKYGGTEKICSNINESINMMFIQEVSPDTLENGTYVKLEPKSMGEMWKRNFINLGYGIHYVGKDNPYHEGWDTSIGVAFFGLLDAALIGGAIASPFLGETTSDKIRLSATFLGTSLIYKILLPLVINKPMVEGYNNFAESGYYIPSGLEN